MAKTLVELFKHNLWANLRIVEACAALSPEDLDATCEGTYGPIGATLVHMLSAEGRYVAEITKKEPDLPLAEGDRPDSDTLKKRARMSGEALTGIAADTKARSKISGVFRGQAYEMHTITLLAQAINHATEHRTHISTILTQRGITPPRTDVLGYWMEGQRG